MRNKVDPYLEALEIFLEANDARVFRALAPSGVRGILLKRGKQGVPTMMRSNYNAYFDWTYPDDNPEMHELYERAKAGQWDGNQLVASRCGPPQPGSAAHSRNVSEYRSASVFGNVEEGNDAFPVLNGYLDA